MDQAGQKNSVLAAMDILKWFQSLKALNLPYPRSPPPASSDPYLSLILIQCCAQEQQLSPLSLSSQGINTNGSHWLLLLSIKSSVVVEEVGAGAGSRAQEQACTSCLLGGEGALIRQEEPGMSAGDTRRGGSGCSVQKHCIKMLYLLSLLFKKKERF